MAWTAPKTWSAGAVLTAAELNTHVRDNLLETAPAKATAAGQIIVSDGVNSVAARQTGSSAVLTSETTTSTSYTDLATSGPSVSSLTTGPRALVMFGCQLENNTGGSSSYMAFDVSGSSALSSSDTYALRYESSNASDRIIMSHVFLRADVTTGTNTFTAKYRVDGGTGSFQNRRLAVVPF